MLAKLRQKYDLTSFLKITHLFKIGGITKAKDNTANRGISKPIITVANDSM